MTVKDLIKKEHERMHGLMPWADSLFNRFEDFWNTPTPKMFRGMGHWNPQVDVKETDNEIKVSVALPGVDKQDIKLNVTENTLNITAERKEEKETSDKEENYRLREQSYGMFQRSFTLPASVNCDKVKANYKDGILKIELLKEKSSHTKKVDIE